MDTVLTRIAYKPEKNSLPGCNQFRRRKFITKLRFMLRNYLKTAWRNLLKNKFYSLINMAGLTAGLAIGILILLWVQDELSFDSFHKNAPNIYRVELWGGTGASRQIWTVGVAPIGPLAKQQLPEVRDAVRLTGNYDFSLYKYQDKVF